MSKYTYTKMCWGYPLPLPFYTWYICTNNEKIIDDLEDLKAFDKENMQIDQDSEASLWSLLLLSPWSMGVKYSFVQVTEKGVAESKLSDPSGHVILSGKIF